MKGFSFGNSSIKYAIILIVLTFIVYGNSIQNGYSLDDHLVNEQNELTQHGIKNFKEIFTSYSFKEKNYNYEYRPVMILSFALEYAVFGVKPHTSHFISVVLFSIFVVLLFNFLKRTFSETPLWVIFFGVVLFIVHPIHSEVVDNIKSRDELLVAIFGISLLMQFQKYLLDKKVLRLLWMILLAALGMLTKESILVFIGVIPFLFLQNCPKGKINFKQFILPALLFAIIFIGIKIGKSHLLHAEVHFREKEFYENPLYFENFWARIPAGFSFAMVYLRLLFWPFVLSYYYGYNEIPIDSWSSIMPYISIIFHCGMIYLVIKYFRKDKLLSFSMTIYLMGILAASGIFKIIPGIIGERFIFFGSAGFTLVIAILFYKFLRQLKWVELPKSELKIKPKAFILSFLVILILGISSNSRNSIWKDEDSLILGDAEHLEHSAKVQDMASFRLLVKIYSESDSPYRNKLIKQAEDHCLQCLEIYPKYINCLNNLGTLYFVEQNYSESEKFYLKALQIDSSDANVLFNLATIRQRLNDLPKANFYYEKALSSDPQILNLIPFYKQFVVKNNKQAQAISFITKILRIFPRNYELHLLIVDLYDDQQDYKNALFYVKKAYKIKPSDELAKFIETLNKLNKK